MDSTCETVGDAGELKDGKESPNIQAGVTSQSEKPFIPAVEVGLGLGVWRVYGNLLSLCSICLSGSTTRLWMKPRTAVGQQIQELGRQPLRRVEAVRTF